MQGVGLLPRDVQGTGVLAPIPAMGEGWAIESFTSRLHRIAATYHVSLADLLKLLATVGSGRRYLASQFKSQIQLLGYSELTSAIVAAHASLTATPLAGGRGATGTFLAMQGVLARNCEGLIAAAIRWCPYCKHPETGLGYDLLAIQVQGIRRCPVHGLALLDTCGTCGQQLGLRGRNDACRCGMALWAQRAEPAKPLSAAEAWFERETLALVEYVAEPVRSSPPADWHDQLCLGLMKLLAADGYAYTDQEYAYLRDVIKSLGSPTCPRFPTWPTLLRIAAIQSVPALDLVLRPKEALARRLFEDTPTPLPKKRKLVRSHAKMLLLREGILRLLSTPEDVTLPSISKLIGEHSVAVRNKYFRNSGLIEIYIREYVRRANLNCVRGSELAFTLAIEIVDRCIAQGVMPQVRRGGIEIQKHAAISKNVAETAMRAAMAYRDIV